MNPKDIYKINDTGHNYATLNEQPRMYDGSPGAVRLDLGQRAWEKYETGISDGEGDNMSCVSHLTNTTDYSKRNLYNKLKETEISLASQSGS
jgi:hypothetical protein